MITKVMSSLEDPELCWWFGGYWMLEKLSWTKWALNCNLKERKEVMKQRKDVIQSKYLGSQGVSRSSGTWLLTWANTHPGRCSGLSFFLMIAQNSQTVNTWVSPELEFIYALGFFKSYPPFSPFHQSRPFLCSVRQYPPLCFQSRLSSSDKIIFTSMSVVMKYKIHIIPQKYQ